MKIFNIKDFKGGWVIGDFVPSIIQKSDFEVAFKTYKSGDFERNHCHHIAEEITIISSGNVKMNKKEYKEGDIILIERNEYTDFLAITDCSTVVIKIPSARNDKYIKE